MDYLPFMIEEELPKNGEIIKTVYNFNNTYALIIEIKSIEYFFWHVSSDFIKVRLTDLINLLPKGVNVEEYFQSVDDLILSKLIQKINNIRIFNFSNVFITQDTAKKYGNISEQIDITYEKIEKLVGRGAKNWYHTVFRRCFEGDKIEICKQGFHVFNYVEKFSSLSSERTLKNNLKKLEKENIIKLTFSGSNIFIKFNANFIPGSLIALPPILYPGIYNRNEEANSINIGIAEYERLIDNSFIKKDEFKYITPSSVEELLLRYFEFLLKTNWQYHEVYKFEFSSWLNERVDINKMSPQELFETCLLSQEQSYSNSDHKGIQFIKSSGSKLRSKFLSIDDVKLFKLALQRELSEADFRSRTISYTALSSWLGTLIPDSFVPSPIAKFNKVYELFSIDSDIPERGYPAFVNNQKILGEVKEVLRSHDLSWLYSDSMEGVRVDSSSEYYLNWICQDFVLYVYRVYLRLYDTSYLKKIEKNHVDVLPRIRNYLISRIERDSNIVKKVKEIYSNECQICKSKSSIAPTKFVEGAHIIPLAGGHDGHDIMSNLLCLCPNHHKLFDIGEFCINEDYSILGLESYSKILIRHPVDKEAIKYHRENIYFG